MLSFDYKGWNCYREWAWKKWAIEWWNSEGEWKQRRAWRQQVHELSAVWRHVHGSQDVVLPAHVLSSLSGRLQRSTDDHVAVARRQERHVSELSRGISASGRRTAPTSGEHVLRPASRTSTNVVECRRRQWQFTWGKVVTVSLVPRGVYLLGGWSRQGHLSTLHLLWSLYRCTHRTSSPRPRQTGKRTQCLKKTGANLFLSELCQISTDFGNLGQKDSKKRTGFSEVYSFSTLPNLCQRTAVLNADLQNCYITL